VHRNRLEANQLQELTGAPMLSHVAARQHGMAA
jgi:hypothetical protein